MNAYMNSMSNSTSCCGHSAVVTSSARLAGIMDTVILAVSIILSRLLGKCDQ